MAVRRAFGCVLLLAAGCGGDAFSTGGGGSSGEGGTTNQSGTDAGGSSTMGGTSRGGSSSAGSTSGGTGSAGTGTAGTSSAGSNSGGTGSGGMSMGGSDTGGSDTGGMSMGGTAGNTTSCSASTDCTSCAYPTAPTNESDCYCVQCADTPMNVKSCENNQQHWEKFCSNQMMPCPAIKCLPSVPPSCEKGRCVDAL